MNKRLRALLSLGLLLFAASFFLPPAYYNTPCKHAGTAWLTLLDGERTTGERLAFFAVLLAVIFSYFGALLAAAALWVGTKGEDWAERMLVVAYTVGGMAITALGITLISIDDPWPSPRVRWYAAIAPGLVIACIWILRNCVRYTQRLPVVLLVTGGFQVPLQFLLTWLVIRYNGPCWGYALGGSGAMISIVVAVALLCRAEGQPVSAGVKE